MTIASRPTNRLLAVLDPLDLATLRSCLEPVVLKTGEVLAECETPAPYAYFLESGMAASVMERKPGASVEVGLTGLEGFIGLSIALGPMQCPRRVIMLVGGVAQRIAARTLTDLVDSQQGFRRVVLSYIHTFLIQVSTSVFAAGQSTVEGRLARWLLMSHDRLQSGSLALTHEFLAMVLGARRPGVTVATHVLEGKKLIKAQRASITILDRPGLEAVAGIGYGYAEAEYRRVFNLLAPEQNRAPSPSAIAAGE